jgi:hypothetical protein
VCQRQSRALRLDGLASAFFRIEQSAHPFVSLAIEITLSSLFVRVKPKGISFSSRPPQREAI